MTISLVAPGLTVYPRTRDIARFGLVPRLTCAAVVPLLRHRPHGAGSGTQSRRAALGVDVGRGTE